MSNRPDVLIEAENHIRDAELRLIEQRTIIREFVRTEHTVNDTLEKQAGVEKSENELAALLDGLLKNRDIAVEFRVQANELCDRCRALNQYPRDMFAALATDLIRRQQAEGNGSKDAITTGDVALLFAATFGMASAVNAGVARGHVTVNQGAAAGFALSASYVFRKRIGRAIRGARKAPALLGKGARVVYYSPAVMDGRIGVRLALQASADAVSVRVIRTVARTKNLTAKIRRLKGPKP